MNNHTTKSIFEKTQIFKIFIKYNINNNSGNIITNNINDTNNNINDDDTTTTIIKNIKIKKILFDIL